MTRGGPGDPLHASAVAYQNRAVLILGASGSGKSALALGLMSLGATLIADDRTAISAKDGQLWAAAPHALPPLIEARGLGLLPVALHPATPILMAVDLDQAPAERMPRAQQIELLGLACPLFAGKIGPHLIPSLFHILTTGYLPQND